MFNQIQLIDLESDNIANSTINDTFMHSQKKKNDKWSKIYRWIEQGELYNIVDLLKGDNFRLDLLYIINFPLKPYVSYGFI